MKFIFCTKMALTFLFSIKDSLDELDVIHCSIIELVQDQLNLQIRNFA